jgi:hypothetical protein
MPRRFRDLVFSRRAIIQFAEGAIKPESVEGNNLDFINEAINENATYDADNQANSSIKHLAIK